MTALDQINAGARVTAALLQGVAPLAAYKGADETVTSSTVLQNDDALFLDLDAAATYFWLMLLDYEGGMQGSSDLKWQFSVPSGAAGILSPLFFSNSGALSFTLGGIAATVIAGTNGAGTKRPLLAAGTIVTSATAGNMQLTWAQNVSSGTGTIVHAGSALLAWQVG